MKTAHIAGLVDTHKSGIAADEMNIDQFLATSNTNNIAKKSPQYIGQLRIRDKSEGVDKLGSINDEVSTPREISDNELGFVGLNNYLPLPRIEEADLEMS